MARSAPAPARGGGDARPGFTPPSRRHEGPEARQAILAATERVLQYRRLDDITVTDLIKEAEVSRAAFYMYFESKHAAVASLALDVAERMSDDVWEPWLRGEESAEEEVLVQHMRDTLGLWREHRAVLVATAEAWRTHSELYAGWGSLMWRYIEELERYIERARASGTAPDGLDAATLAAVLVWGNESTMYLHFSGAAPELQDEDQLAKTLAGVWLRAIYGRVP